MAIQLCVVGAGKIFQNFHLASINKTGNFKIKYIVDKNFNLAERIALDLGATAIDDVSKIDDCDVCFVATPPSTRLAIYNAIKDKEMAIVFEKPISFDYDTAKYIVEDAKQRGKLVMVAHTRRFFPNLMLIRQLVSNKFFNEKIDISIYEGGLFGWVTESNYMNNDNNSDQGVIHDIGSHVFDYILLIIKDLGITFEEIQVIKSIKDYTNLANNAFVELKVGNNITVKVRLSREILLSNKIVVNDTHRSLISGSAYDNQITIKLNDFSYNIQVSNKYNMGKDLEDAFDLMWKTISERYSSVKYNDFLLNIDGNTVLDNSKLIDSIINSSVLKSEDNYFLTYKHE